MATVWRARANDNPMEIVALKILHQARITAEETRRLRREFLTLQRLDHPHIVKVLDAGEHSGYPWLALRYVAGGDLGKRIEAWKAQPPSDRFVQVETITRALCSALAYVHEKGIVHRDLKPANVLIDEEGTAWLTDFGVVKDVENFSTNLTVAGRLVGTVAFMAPEQITGEPVDSRADLYGLGALMYAMLTGRRPVVADSIAAYLARQLAEMPKAPIEVDARVPPRLDRICMRLLQKEPAARFASAREVLAALDAPSNSAALPLHGQAETIARIESRLSALADGVSGCVLLAGPRGSGRTRLLDEVAAKAKELGLETAKSEATPTAQVVLVDDADDAPSTVHSALGARAEATTSGPPVLFVLTASESNHPCIAEIAGGLPVEDIQILPLDRDALRALLRDHGAGGGLGAALTRRLGAELGGLPGLAVAQLTALVEAGWLARATDGSLRAVKTIDQLRVDPLPLPPAERAASAARLAALGREDRRVVEAIAILAMPASVEVIAQTSGVPHAEAVIQRIERAGWVVLRDEGLQQLVEQRSVRAGQAVCESMPAAVAAELHGLAAQALRERYGQRGGAISALVAHHLERAGRPAEARPLLVQAAQSAFRRGEFAEARGLAERAVTLDAFVPQSPDDVRLRLTARSVLADCFRALGRLRQARRVWGEALELSGVSADERSRIRCTRALLMLESGDETEAERELSDGLASMSQGQGCWAEACHAAAGIAHRRGKLPEAAERWAALALHAGDTKNSVAVFLADIGSAVLAGASDEQWTALFERAVATTKLLLVLETAARLAMLRLGRGDAAAAAELGDRLGEFAHGRESIELDALTAAVVGKAAQARGEATIAGEAKQSFEGGEWRHPLVRAVWNA